MSVSQSALKETCDLLLRARWALLDPDSPDGAQENAGLAIRDGDVVAAGPWQDIDARFAGRELLHLDDAILMPGFVNAHDHGRGLTARQLGIEDDYLEPWLVDLMAMPTLDCRLDTQLAALDQLTTGITTSIHSYYHVDGEGYGSTLDAVAAGYQDAGMRAGVIASFLDRSQLRELLVAVLPELVGDVRAFVDDRLARSQAPLYEPYFQCLEQRAEQMSDALWYLCGPVSIHWASDSLLSEIGVRAKQLKMPVQAHLLESPLQRIQQDQGDDLLQRLDRAAWPSDAVSMAHGVYLSEDEMRGLAQRNISVVHNPSSNLRLGNGVARVTQMLSKGVTVALGLDSQPLGDRPDMFQEMRLADALQRQAGHNISHRQWLAMATSQGAKAIGKSTRLGRLLPGYCADFMVLSLGQMDPWLGAEDPWAMAVETGRPQAIERVYVGGQLRVKHGGHVALDRRQLQRQLEQQARSQEAGLMELRRHLRALKPFLQGWRQRQLASTFP